MTSIGDYAFFRCDALTEVTIPGSVTSIGDYAFESCSSLTEVTIPGSVTTIGGAAFGGCNSLTEVTISDGESVLSFSSDVFSGSPVETLYLGRTVSGRMPFIGIKSLKTLTIGNSVTSIGEGAFMDCSGLTEVTIPGSVTSIGALAFDRCSGLTEVTIPNSVTSIGEGAFWDCSSLTEVTISDGEDILAFLTSASSPIFNGSPVETLYLGRTISGRMSFIGIKSLKTLTIGNSVTSIDDFAFAQCSGLTEVTIPNSVTSIGEGAFWDCSSLTEVTISDGEDILAFPTSASSSIFNGSPVETLYLGRTISGSMPFAGIESLKTLTIGNNVTSIGDYAFAVCSGLTEVTIPNSVTSIDDFAFAQCSGLTEVTIGNSVTSIGILVFGACSALTTLYSLSTTPPSVESISFDDNHYATVDLFVPEEALEAYQTAEVWKEFQKLQAIGGTATAIEKVSAAEQIHSANGQITVTGLTDGTTVTVYDLSGKQVGTATSKGGQVSISTGMTAGAAAVVKISDKSVKTMMK